jgi:hypothetical protein
VIHDSIGEESFSTGKTPSLTDEPTFCVDPIGEPAGQNVHLELAV